VTLAPPVVALAVSMVVVVAPLLPLLARTAGRMVLVPIPVRHATISYLAIRLVLRLLICKAAARLTASGFPPDTPGLL
jgi:hypothetical protein